MPRAEGVLFTIQRESARQWPAVRPAWLRLHATSEAPTFFLSPIWMDAWLAVFGAELEPEFLSLESAGVTRAVALLSRRTERRGPFRIRQLLLNTAGEGKASPMLEHNALVCAEACRPGFAAALLELIDLERWDEFLLSGIRRLDYDEIVARCALPREENWRPAPYVDLALLRSSGKPYLDSLSRNTRQQIRRSIGLYEARGGLILEQADSVATALEWLEELITLHEAAWQERGRPGAFASPSQRSFHQRLIAAGVLSREVELLRVRSGSDTVGVLYNLCHAGHISYYQSGFRYEGDNRLKPGLVCHALAIQRALDAGNREYDFLAATNEGARYKTSLSNAEREFGWITFRRNGLRLRTLDGLSRLRQRLPG